MRPSDVITLLTAMLPAKHAPLLTGAPGVGKSQLVDEARQIAGFKKMITSHPVLSDPTEAKGIPWMKADAKFAEWIPYGDLYEILNTKVPLIWFIDDIGQATQATQASYMQPLLTRKVNGKKIPDCVTMVAATNRRTDRAGVSGLLEPVKSRFITIVSVDPDLDDWCAWAIRTNQPPELIAFLRFRPELLHQFTPTLDLVNSPNPRTWESAGKILRLNLPRNIELAALVGTVGEAAAGQVTAFLRTWRELPSLDGILADPSRADIPTEPSALYAVAVGLAFRANANNFGRIGTYADRLLKSDRGEFAALMVRDSTRRDKKIFQTPAYIKLMSTDVGKLFSGETIPDSVN